jgi:hypothetical protein
MPGLCAIHQKAIEPSQFGYKLWYIIKAPCKAVALPQKSCFEFLEMVLGEFLPARWIPRRRLISTRAT